ncbi:MAG: hypothetical protein KC619_35035 [Myxococcales bacterium]|nr:hypothetical protein [Myxococcales bacterium]
MSGSDDPGQTLSTLAGSVTLLPEGIVVLRSGPVDHSLEIAADGIAAIRKLAGGRPRPTLADARQIGRMTREARVHYAESTSELIRAMAVLVSSPFSRLVGSFFIRLGRPEVPVRLFTSEPEAMAWLSTFVEP